MNNKKDESSVAFEEDENERRFLVRSIDPQIFNTYPWRSIRQGYLDAASGNAYGVRIRVETDSTLNVMGTLVSKTGKGAQRKEKSIPVSLNVAFFMIESTKDRLSKVRYLRDGWEVDRFQDRLSFITLAELETETPQESLDLPEWIYEAIDVTDHLGNRDLARFNCLLREKTIPSDMEDRFYRYVSLLVETGQEMSRTLKKFVDSGFDPESCELPY